MKILWKSTWLWMDGTVTAEFFKTRKAALAHNGHLLRCGFTVQGVTKVVL